MRIQFDANQVILKQVHTYNYTLIENNIIEIQFNDIFAKDEKAVLINFKKNPEYVGSISIQGYLFYEDAQNELKTEHFTQLLQIEKSDSKNDYNTSFNRMAALGYAIMVSTEKMALALDAAEKSEYKEAESILKESDQILDNYKSAFGEHDFLSQIKLEIKTAEKNIKEMQKSPKRNRSIAFKRMRHAKHKFMYCPRF